MGLPNRVLLSAVTSGWLLGMRPAWRRFVAAAQRPDQAQAELLRQFLRDNADTDRGRRLGFDRIDSLRAFQDRVPIVSYEELRADCERIAAGEQGVLSRAPVEMMERSSGTTGGNKLLPFTRPFLDQMAAATGPWLYSLYATRPQLLGTTSYWSVSPASQEQSKTQGGLRIGFEDDTEYFSPIERWAIKRLLAVPSEVRNIPEIDAWRRATAIHLLSSVELGLISIWNPSFLTLLLQSIESNLEQMLIALPGPRAAQIRTGLDRAGAFTGRALWPRLGLISCWADGNATAFLSPLLRYFPDVEIQAKGLLATEGVVSFPLSPARGQSLPGSVLAIGSHFLELIDLEHERDRPRSAADLRVGGRYTPLLTTGAGLCRYRLADELECVGYYADTPLVRFVGKLDRSSDLCGEKLTGADVDRALQAARARTGLTFPFALLTPHMAPGPHYRLYLEGLEQEQALSAIAEAVDGALMAGHHYKYCRSLGQLGPVVALSVKAGWASYERELVRRGMKAGEIKPTQLDPALGWEQIYERC